MRGAGIGAAGGRMKRPGASPGQSELRGVAGYAERQRPTCGRWRVVVRGALAAVNDFDVGINAIEGGTPLWPMLRAAGACQHPGTHPLPPMLNPSNCSVVCRSEPHLISLMDVTPPLPVTNVGSLFDWMV